MAKELEKLIKEAKENQQKDAKEEFKQINKSTIKILF
jgi:hypothetical protein